MKIKQILMTIGAAFALNIAIQAQSLKYNMFTPAGELSATPKIVQSGTYPTLNWKVTYPSNIGNVAIVNAQGEIFLKKDIYVGVSVIGTGITSDTPIQNKNDIYSEIRIREGNSNYQRLFYALNEDVTPQYSSYIKKLDRNSSFGFGARFVKDGEWTPFYTNNSGNHQVITLTHGQEIPVHQENIAEFLKPYIDSTNKVNIGPMSALMLFELGTTNHAHSAFDYQDAAILVKLSNKHQNNGHGNNLDGVDSSNPSNGNGGPNGTVDPSGGVDDEK
jgi:hypothetical protein